MNKKVEEKSRDIRDINYFIDHVKNVPLRIDIIKKLGYKIGFNIANEKSYEKDITIGKKNDIRIQIVPKDKSFPLVQCAIID